MRLLFLLLFCLIPAWVNAFNLPAFTAVNSTGDPIPTDIILWYRAEALQMTGDDYYGDDSLWSAASGAVINTDAVKYGTNGVDFPTAADFLFLSILNEDNFNATNSRVGMWVYVNTFVANAQLFRVLLNATNIVEIRFSTTGSNHFNVVYEDNDVQIYVDHQTTISNSQWYFVEMEIDISGGDVAIYVDGLKDNDASVPAGDGWVATGVNINFGNTQSAASDFYCDNLMISNDHSRDFYNDTFNGTPFKDLTESPR